MIPAEIILEKIADTRSKLFKLDSMDINKLDDEDRETLMKILTVMDNVCVIMFHNIKNRLTNI